MFALACADVACYVSLQPLVFDHADLVVCSINSQHAPGQNAARVVDLTCRLKGSSV